MLKPAQVVSGPTHTSSFGYRLPELKQAHRRDSWGQENWALDDILFGCSSKKASLGPVIFEVT